MASFISNWEGDFSNPSISILATSLSGDLETAYAWFQNGDIDQNSIVFDPPWLYGQFNNGGDFQMYVNGVSGMSVTIASFAIRTPDDWIYQFDGRLTVNASNLAMGGYIDRIILMNPFGYLFDIYGRISAATINPTIDTIVYQIDADHRIEIAGKMRYNVLTGQVMGTVTSVYYLESGHAYLLTNTSLPYQTLAGYADLNALVADLMAGDDSIVGTKAFEVLKGFVGNDTLNGLGGADILIGGEGNDTYMVNDLNVTIVENANEGDDLVKSSISLALPDNLERLILLGAQGIDGNGNTLDNVLIGNRGANVLLGDAGNDSLDGGAGKDSLFGGLGNDKFFVDHAGDVVTEFADEGVDTVQSTVSYVLSEHIENLILLGRAVINAVGNDGNNTLTGNAAANLLDGGKGNDTMIGDGGNDTYKVDSPDDVVHEETLNGGIDLVKASINYVLGDALENLTLEGDAAINGTGNALANRIIGNGLANTLDGGEGKDTLTGAGGDDIYVVDLLTQGQGLAAKAALQDIVVESQGLNGGIDTLRLRGTTTTGLATLLVLDKNLEHLDTSGTGSSLLNLKGNRADNELTGNDADNQLDGSFGIDRLTGGKGNDTYLSDALDLIVEQPDEGIDNVKIMASGSTNHYALADNVENALLVSRQPFDLTGNVLDNLLIGNAAANILSGGNGNDRLDGRGGKDRLIGGLGSDDYWVDNPGDEVVEFADEGTDTVNAAISYRLGEHVEHLMLLGQLAINGTGNDGNNSLVGNAGRNVLDGGVGDDNLLGGLGADVLIGGIGLDQLDGEAGDDVYIVESGSHHTQAEIHDSSGTADLVRFASNTEDDTLVLFAGDTGIESIQIGTGLAVNSAISTAITRLNVDAGALGNAITMTGNAGNNRLIGSDFDDRLFGGRGNDLLIGGLGNDVLEGGLGDDGFVLAATGADNADLIRDFKPNTDRIILDLGTFTALTGSSGDSLDADEFALGTAATTDAQRIVYDTKSGALYYDPDGKGIADPVAIAIVGEKTHPMLQASDFLLMSF